MIEVWLVRHGETDWNKERRLQGWTDIPLNEAGHSQAKKLSEYLEGVPFEHIYTSDLSRAHHTAEHLRHKTGAPLTVDQRLRERRFGAEEGSIRQEAVNFVQQSLQDSADRKIVDREPHHELMSRLHSFFQDVCRKHHRGRVLAVTHGGVIRSILSSFGVSTDHPIENTGVSRLRFDGQQWSVDVVNGADHLK